MRRRSIKRAKKSEEKKEKVSPLESNLPKNRPLPSKIKILENYQRRERERGGFRERENI